MTLILSHYEGTKICETFIHYYTLSSEMGGAVHRRILDLSVSVLKTYGPSSRDRDITCNESDFVICEPKVVMAFVGNCPKGHPGKALKQSEKSEYRQDIESPWIHFELLCS